MNIEDPNQPNNWTFTGVGDGSWNGNTTFSISSSSLNQTFTPLNVWTTLTIPGISGTVHYEPVWKWEPILPHTAPVTDLDAPIKFEPISTDPSPLGPFISPNLLRYDPPPRARGVEFTPEVLEKLAELPQPPDDEWDGPMMTLERARELRLCRFCGYEQTDGPGLPFVFNFGKEYAHRACTRPEELYPKESEVTIPENVYEDFGLPVAEGGNVGEGTIRRLEPEADESPSEAHRSITWPDASGTITWSGFCEGGLVGGKVEAINLEPINLEPEDEAPTRKKKKKKRKRKKKRKKKAAAAARRRERQEITEERLTLLNRLAWVSLLCALMAACIAYVGV